MLKEAVTKMNKIKESALQKYSKDKPPVELHRKIDAANHRDRE